MPFILFVQEPWKRSGPASQVVTRLPEPEDIVDAPVPSVVQVTARPRRRLALQPTGNLIMKAISEANKSLATMPQRPDSTQVSSIHKFLSYFVFSFCKVFLLLFCSTWFQFLIWFKFIVTINKFLELTGFVKTFYINKFKNLQSTDGSVAVLFKFMVLIVISVLDYIGFRYFK